LLEVLAQSLPEPILSMIIKKMSEDVRQAQETGAKIEELE
jgi:hypothetical protein